MSGDVRFSRMLHVLIHMSQMDGVVTSAEIGKMLDTNPVVARRLMSGLRDCAYVQSEKGHGGGWALSCSLEELTLLDVYLAIGEPSIFALGIAADRPECLVEQAVSAGVAGVLVEAEELLRARLRRMTVADIAKSVHPAPATACESGTCDWRRSRGKTRGYSGK